MKLFCPICKGSVEVIEHETDETCDILHLECMKCPIISMTIHLPKGEVYGQ